MATPFPIAVNLPLAASADFASPLLWAVVIGWILSVVVHEFAHGVVAYLGGDYTIKERGGLTLNPLQYIDPVMSVILPVVFLLMGGVPLPGGVTFVRNDLLKNRAWITAVALAGPASNFLLMLFFLGLLHPALGIFDVTQPVSQWSNGQVFVGALAVLQGVAVMLNLVPCPPLDGFNALAPYLPEDLVNKLRTPPFNFMCLLAFFFLIAQHPLLWKNFYLAFSKIAVTMGLPRSAVVQVFDAYNTALFGG